MALETRFDPANLALRSHMSLMLEIPELNRDLAGALSGFGLTYPSSEMFRAGPGVGERLPDRAITLANGEETTIHALFAEGKWVHLSFDDKSRVDLPVWLSPDAVRFVQCQLTGPQAVRESPGAVLARPDGYCAGRIGAPV